MPQAVLDAAADDEASYAVALVDRLEGLLGLLQAELDRIEGALRTAPEGSDELRSAQLGLSRVAREYRAACVSLGSLRGELGVSVSVTLAPELLRAVMGALDGHDEARLAVVEALDGLGGAA